MHTFLLINEYYNKIKMSYPADNKSISPSVNLNKDLDVNSFKSVVGKDNLNSKSSGSGILFYSGNNTDNHFHVESSKIVFTNKYSQHIYGVFNKRTGDLTYCTTDTKDAGDWKYHKDSFKVYNRYIQQIYKNENKKSKL